MELNNSIAFALGGLSGNNAHGAGFLQAAMEMGTEPAMISFSSGQILWVFRYLQEKNQKMQCGFGCSEYSDIKLKEDSM